MKHLGLFTKTLAFAYFGVLLATAQLIVPQLQMDSNHPKAFEGNSDGPAIGLVPIGGHLSHHQSSNLVNPSAWHMPKHEPFTVLAASCSDADKLDEDLRGLCTVRVQLFGLGNSNKEAGGEEDRNSVVPTGFAYLNPAASYPSQVQGRFQQRIRGLDAGRKYVLGMAVAASGDLQSCSVAYRLDGTGSGFRAGDLNYGMPDRGNWQRYGPVEVHAAPPEEEKEEEDEGEKGDKKQRKGRAVRRGAEKVRAVQKKGKNRKKTAELEVQISCPYFSTFPTGHLAITDVELVDKS